MAIHLWETPPEQFLRHQSLLPFAALSQTDEPKIVLNRVAQEIDKIDNKNINK